MTTIGSMISVAISPYFLADSQDGHNTIEGIIQRAQARAIQALLRSWNAGDLGNGNHQIFEDRTSWYELRGDTVRLLPNGRILRLDGDPSRNHVYVYRESDRSWVSIGTRNGNTFTANQQFATLCPGVEASSLSGNTGHIQQILTSRDRTGVASILSCNGRYRRNGNWQYIARDDRGGVRPLNHLDYSRHMDIFRVLSNGQLIGLSRETNSNNVCILNGTTGQWQTIGTMNGGTFTPSNLSGSYSSQAMREEIQRHIVAIRAARIEHGYIESAPAHISNHSHRRYPNGTWVYSGTQYPELIGNPMTEVNIPGIGNCFIMRTADNIIIFQNNQVHSIRDLFDDCFAHNRQRSPEILRALNRIREAQRSICWGQSPPQRSFITGTPNCHSWNGLSSIFNPNLDACIWNYNGNTQTYDSILYHDTVTGNSYILSRDGNRLYRINSAGTFAEVGWRNGNEARVESCSLSPIWEALARNRSNGITCPSSFYQGAPR